MSGLPLPQSDVSARDDRPFHIVNALLSTGALSLLAWLLLIHRGEPGSGLDLRFMPAVNATLNGLSACLLATGWWAIRQKRWKAHRALMLSAFASSALFLVGYLAYHFIHGDTRYAGEGPMKVLYLAVLASHVVLSMGIVPAAFAAFYFAFRKDFAKHTRITRLLMPAWLYVSVTGVLIFFMLRASYGG